MNDIKEFSRETIEEIGFYVYRLIDPRNGQTFYVGKGKGNRVFQHVLGALDGYEGVKDEDGEENNDPNKLRIIREINDAGLKVIHVIQRWHLTEKEAFQVESALIDAFPGLANIQSGHGSEYGVCNADELEARFTATTYNEPDNFKYMIIKVKPWRLDEMAVKYGSNNARYEATRGCWRIKLPDVKKYPYVLSVTNGIVREVYKVTEWHENGERKEFTGVVAPEEIRYLFVKKRIPDYYAKKGMASPVLKSKN